MSVKHAIFSVAKLSTVTQILLFLPLTLSTLSQSAFLALSLFLFLHSVIHGTLLLIFGPGMLSLLQVPMHPFLLLLSFNLFSRTPYTILITLSTYWGMLLKYMTIVFVAIEAIASLLVAQTLGMEGKRLAGESETWQFSLLIACSVAYVSGAWWIIASYPAAAVSPLSSTLLGVLLTAFVFLTLIGFTLRRTNIVESSLLLLYIAFNIWLSGYEQASFSGPITSQLPLLDNILPHLKSLVYFITNTLPRPVLLSLGYRLTVLHLSSRIMPNIGKDAWERESGFESDDERPTSKFTHILLTYRQSIFIMTYTHLLLLEPSSQIWWHLVTSFICLSVWAVEILLAADDDELDGGVGGVGKSWKMD